MFDTECCLSLSEKADVGYSGNKIVLKVTDCIEAVQKLAANYREGFKMPIVGITGSVGKTTTREMISLALSAGKKVYATPGNRNSQIGTPETIFDFDTDAEVGVLEMGMSMPGEMRKLAKIVKPDIAVFTNIGITHIENLGSREAILEEKMHITDYMKEGDMLILNHENDLLRSCMTKPGLKVCFYGFSDDCDVFAKDIVIKGGCPEFTASVNGKEVRVRLSVYGNHMILNALAGLAAADHFNIDIDKAAEKLSEYTGYEHRNSILNNGGLTIIDDTYNAAPDSMKAAINMLCDIPCSGRRIAVLADMKELGEKQVDEHVGIGIYAAEKKCIDMLITYGELGIHISAGFGSSGTDHFTDGKSLEEYILHTLKPGDLVLFKGSNSMRLFDLVDKVMNHEFD